MKVEIPDSLKQDVPQTIWGKILTATPVVMAVLATMLAGLSSSEMTRAQYDRSLAAQQQSKAGDQWGFFQAKRLRGALQRSTLDVLQGLAPVRPLSTELIEKIPSEARDAMVKGEVPVAPVVSVPGTNATVEALTKALHAAEEQVSAFDAALQPINKMVEKAERELMAPSITRDLTAARLRYAAARYDAEARLNQSVANIYELQVRKSNQSAERHHRRSQRFFFGMLAAQCGVIIATFAIAARKRNLLWSLAAAAGTAAIGFSVYVYLFV